jgi:hypothetical protein
VRYSVLNTRYVDAHAPGDSPVDAHSAPRLSSVDANIAPEYMTVEAQTNTAPDRIVSDYSVEVSVESPAPDSTVPDYSVEVPDPDYYPVDHILAPHIYSVEAHIMKLPCSELASKKFSVAPELVAKCLRQDSVRQYIPQC